MDIDREIIEPALTEVVVSVIRHLDNSNRIGYWFDQIDWLFETTVLPNGDHWYFEDKNFNGLLQDFRDDLRDSDEKSRMKWEWRDDGLDIYIWHGGKEYQKFWPLGGPVYDHFRPENIT